MLSFENTIRWVFFNVILALVPLLLNFFLVKVARVTTTWHKMLKDGELYIFSSTIAAASIGKEFLDSSSKDLTSTVTVFALIIILMLSAAMFSLSSFLKFREESCLDEKLFSGGSISCAIVAGILSYVVFVQ